jgi:hypothetical protein
MAGKVVNSSLVLLSKFGASRQESASKTATSHIRKPLAPRAHKLKFPQKNPIGDMKNKYPNETLRFCFGGGVT